MRAVTTLGAVLLVIASASGCASMHQCCGVCDPCATMAPPPTCGGCGGWFKHKIESWRARHSCRNAGCATCGCATTVCDGGCDSGLCGSGTCGAGGCGATMMGGESFGSTGCASCGGGAAPTTTTSGYPPAPSPAAAPTPVPEPEDAAPVPPETSKYVPLRQAPPTVVSSYEEFQRLPGVIISGPGAAAPAATNVAAVPPSPAPTAPAAAPTPIPAAAPAPAHPVQPATFEAPPAATAQGNWVPARR